MAINAIGNGIPFPRGEGIPSAVRDSMVLWYDLKRQGATNESMSANPKLIDLSGNGHDATCYNFAWSGMSSIGGYYFTFIHFEVEHDGLYNIEHNDDLSKVTLTKTNVERQLFYILCTQVNINDSYHCKIKINGIDAFKQKYPNAIMYANSQTEEDIDINIIEKDGIYEFTGISHSDYVSLRLIVETSVPANEEINITIEQLPFYPNALVADGVDDYVRVDGIILTDFTIIAKRKRLDADLAKRGTLASKLPRNINDGAFAFEYIQANTNERQAISFGGFNIIQMVDTDISYMTKNSYNGTPIKSGQKQDTNYLTLFSTRESSGCAQAALYSFILFDRTLTTKEIDWVKHNLIEGDTEL